MQAYYPIARGSKSPQRALPTRDRLRGIRRVRGRVGALAQSGTPNRSRYPRKKDPALLPQPGGFEGLSFSLKHSGTDRQAVAELDELNKGWRFDFNTALHALPTDASRREHSVFVQSHAVLEVHAKALEGLHPRPKELANAFRTAIGPCIGKRIEGLPLEIWMRSFKRGAEVAAVERLDYLSNCLHVLLRHRPAQYLASSSSTPAARRLRGPPPSTRTGRDGSPSSPSVRKR